MCAYVVFLGGGSPVNHCGVIHRCFKVGVAGRLTIGALREM